MATYCTPGDPGPSERRKLWRIQCPLCMFDLVADTECLWCKANTLVVERTRGASMFSHPSSYKARDPERQHPWTEQISAAVWQGQGPSPKGRYERFYNWQHQREKDVQHHHRKMGLDPPRKSPVRKPQRTRLGNMAPHVATVQDKSNDPHHKSRGRTGSTYERLLGHICRSTRRVVQLQFKKESREFVILQTSHVEGSPALSSEHSKEKSETKKETHSKHSQKRIRRDGAVLLPPPGYGMTGYGTNDAHRFRLLQQSFFVVQCSGSRDPSRYGTST